MAVKQVFAYRGTVVSPEVDQLLVGPKPQQMVKDEVIFTAPIDPQLALARASQRVSEGKSVFFETERPAQAQA